MPPGEDGAVAEAPRRSNAYELFIFVLTVLSLVLMVGLLLPTTDATTELLTVYDNAICVVFLIDFVIRLRRAHPKGAYLFQERGWLDLLGSIPSLGVVRVSALFRLARLSRLARITRLVRGQGRREIVRDVVRNRGQYAAFITVITAFVILALSSVLVLQFESRAEGASITTGGSALWWAIVTITTVGYGDTYPLTAAGRLTAVFVMLAGIGVIGSLASILASVLVPQPEEGGGSESAADLREELSGIRRELEALRRSIDDANG
jgi:voltage-gated potassium channel